jgi:chromosome partitioning protein
MERVIGVLNYKGGTGKTTTAINLAAGLALRGARTLLVDLDPQGSIASLLGVKFKHTLTDLITGQALPSSCIYPSRDNLDVLPSNQRLLAAEGELWDIGNRAVARRVLGDKLRNADDNYEYIVVDFPPSATLLTESGLLYINDLIIPMTMSHMSILGTRQVIATLRAISRIPNHTVRLLYIVPTLFQSRLRKDRSILETMEKKFVNQVSDPIRSNVSLAEAPAEQKTIFEYAPRSNGAADYAKLVERVATSS